MDKNMEVNFKYLKERVEDALKNSDLEFINFHLSKLDKPTIFSGVGGSKVVSNLGAKVINKKNNIIAISSEPRDFIYRCNNGFDSIISCSYSGNNYGVDLAFDNNSKKYLLSNNKSEKEDIINLQYNTTLDKERSFISLGASLIPISMLMNYYLKGNFNDILELIDKTDYCFDLNSNCFEIFTGYDTSTASTYLESTIVESGLGFPILHDKYSFCHGRTTLSINFKNIAIYFSRNTQFDQLVINQLKDYYSNVVIIDTQIKDDILADYQLLIKSMYLTKYMAQKKGKDLSAIEYSPLVKELYKYKGEI